MESYSLFELNEYIKRVIALNFSEPIWVHGEIGQIANSRGNYYLDIIEKDENTDSILAQSAGVIWYKSYLSIKKKLGSTIDALLQQGVEVKLKVQLDFHERYGLKLKIVDIDPNYTLGQLEILRQQNLQKLEDAKMLHLNEDRELPIVLQRIAVISSATAAGYADFMAQLDNNDYGYAFETMLFDCRVQGPLVKKEVPQALEQISALKDKFDCVVIIRGGGSKMDLSGFDEYEVGKSIAQCMLPAITGIGHEIDQSIADIVAHSSMKTPTAVAEFIIQRNMSYDAQITEIGDSINRYALERINHQKQLLDNLGLNLKQIIFSKTEYQTNQLDYKWQALQKDVTNLFQSKNIYLESMTKNIDFLDPVHILKRGYAFISMNGESISSIKNIEKNNLIAITIHDGEIQALVQNKKIAK